MAGATADYSGAVEASFMAQASHADQIAASIQKGRVKRDLI